MLNPLASIARRWTPSPRTLRRAALSAVVMSVLIIVTGGAVRLTGSGLGCDTWPKCTDDSLFATPEQGLHGAIEFGNRMLTYVLSAAVGWAIVSVRSVKPRRRGLTRLAWVQFWIVLSNAVLGGITVWMGLNPWTVAGHFLAANALLTVAVVTWHRTGEGDTAPRPRVPRPVRRLSWAIAITSGLLIALGTAVTGSGKHAGDSSDVPRMPWDWTNAAHLHAIAAWIVCALAVAMWLVLRAVDAPDDTRARARDLLIVLLLQGGIGYVQYFTGVPEILVGAHMLGSSLMWIAVVRLALSMRERPLSTPAIPAQADPELAKA
ncbi:COX15/CtaA family protein [Streptomyces cinereoruber]|uniref:Cytochrome b561 n=1 Tax=Streptomyces cinereoruber TaxID=67260 RepID=A0AAV4KJD9_9ACTN|nr:COX15/CtaA family protein [Streptomyces cinereoruber]MBB4161893.1 cytochrome c oxidase assembly protein subunit 15 [Streptomyces cinereoruber]MBY8817185.1 COX15/CtaA family protein [Streptomyces cinereoruber]NIH64505.1 cytochrome c oxidase assembly protein subunit 15 [Streptomyces cinereoruber]QEV32215.1 heme A synthase [Streptomyces cinereoruber]GGR27296.1 cytochrome b561 [Streptomyces cinereoruber]